MRTEDERTLKGLELLLQEAHEDVRSAVQQLHYETTTRQYTGADVMHRRINVVKVMMEKARRAIAEYDAVREQLAAALTKVRAERAVAVTQRVFDAQLTVDRPESV